MTPLDPRDVTPTVGYEQLDHGTLERSFYCLWCAPRQTDGLAITSDDPDLEAMECETCGRPLEVAL